MSTKPTSGQKTPPEKSPRPKPEVSREKNKSFDDREIKAAAGEVQEELQPIRRSAGHSHTH